MEKRLDLSKWVLTRYFHYRSSVRDRIAEYEEIFRDNPSGDVYVKELYEHFYEVYKVYAGLKKYSQPDNKTVCEITNIETGEKLYIGSFDCIWALGKDYWSEFGSGSEIGIKR
mgnify:CR=1 FL=1